MLSGWLAVPPQDLRRVSNKPFHQVTSESSLHTRFIVVGEEEEGAEKLPINSDFGRLNYRFRTSVCRAGDLGVFRIGSHESKSGEGG